jgi:hypothetical protein
MNEDKAVIGSLQLGLVAGITFNGCILYQHHPRNKLPVLSSSRLEAQASRRIFIEVRPKLWERRLPRS